MPNKRTASDITEELRHCLRAHDRERVVRTLLGAVAEGMSIEDLYTQVVEPFVKWVGSEWQEGRTAVWEEHLIVAAVRTAVEALYPQVLERRAAIDPLPLTVAFFCPPEETHDLGLHMLADRFDLRGFRTVWVGAVTPVDQMIECVRAVGAAVVCLSASTHYQRTALREVVRRLHEGLPEVRILVGGPAFAFSADGWEKYTVDSVDALLDELAGEAAAHSGGSTNA